MHDLLGIACMHNKRMASGRHAMQVLQHGMMRAGLAALASC
jgi:hypothetical protein